MTYLPRLCLILVYGYGLDCVSRLTIVDFVARCPFVLVLVMGTRLGLLRDCKVRLDLVVVINVVGIVFSVYVVWYLVAQGSRFLT